MKLTIYEEEYLPKTSLPIKGAFEKGDFLKLDLSADNPLLQSEEIRTVEGLQNHISGQLKAAHAKCGFGGYGEKRDLYQRSAHFSATDAWRSIHLGVDFWMPAGTKVRATLPGKVHSFRDNDNPGDYGSTIILQHHIGNEVIHSLYGHLSRPSLAGLEVGQLVVRGEMIGRLGEPFENRAWPPHLHFQLIKDMGDFRGDYPGVCTAAERDRYLLNCPDPISYLAWNKTPKKGFLPL